MGWQPGDAGQKQRRWRPGGGSSAPQSLSRRSTFFSQQRRGYCPPSAVFACVHTTTCTGSPCLSLASAVTRRPSAVITQYHTNCSIHRTVCSLNRKWHSRTYTHTLSLFLSAHFHVLFNWKCCWSYRLLLVRYCWHEQQKTSEHWWVFTCEFITSEMSL